MKYKHTFNDGRGGTNLDEIPICENCKHCTDTLFDYTNGDYLWLCNKQRVIDEYDLNKGRLAVCPLGKDKPKKKKEKQ